MQADVVHRAIAAVAPIEGVMIVDPEDRATWIIHFREEATEEQRTAARAALASLSPAAPTADDVRREYQRRLITLLGATDLSHAAWIRADDAHELAELLERPAPTQADTLRIHDLRQTRAAIAHIIERYNALLALPSVPPDYTSDTHW